MDPGQPLVFRYDGIKPFFWMVAIGGPISVVAVPLIAYLTGGDMPVSTMSNGGFSRVRVTVTSGRPFFVIPGWAVYTLVTPLLAVGVFLLARVLWLKWQNEKIVVAHGEITWTDSKGIAKVTCPLSAISPNDLQKPSGSTPGVGWYTLRTSHGNI